MCEGDDLSITGESGKQVDESLRSQLWLTLTLADAVYGELEADTIGILGHVAGFF